MPITTARDDTFCDSSLGPLDFSFETIHSVSNKAGIMSSAAIFSSVLLVELASCHMTKFLFGHKSSISIQLREAVFHAIT